MIEEKIHIVRQKIETACEKSGRKISDVKLIAVSKNHTTGNILEALNFGIKDFGENKAQELQRKAEKINDDLRWHFVGHLQTNKVKYVIKSADYIHSVDSVKLAAEISKRAAKENKTQKILLEVNTSGEESKFGLQNEEELFKLTEECRSLENVELHGLMTMAPYTEDESVIRKSFASLRQAKDKLNSSGFDLGELSMGMTNDYETAIEEGATMIRIGTAIFGERVYHPKK